LSGDESEWRPQILGYEGEGANIRAIASKLANIQAI
jgi:hypothetical protein